MSGNFKNWQPWRRKEGAESGEGPRSGRGPREFVEEVRVSGKNLVSEVERLLREGQVRHLRIKQKDRVLLDIPIAFAAVGALLAPALAAVGAIAAVVTDCTIEITRTEDKKPAPKPTPARPEAKPSSASSTGVPKTPDDLSYR